MHIRFEFDKKFTVLSMFMEFHLILIIWKSNSGGLMSMYCARITERQIDIMLVQIGVTLKLHIITYH